MINWKYGACGEFFDYKGYTVVKQDHPKLSKYQITKEDANKDLIHITTADTINDVKQTINELCEN